MSQSYGLQKASVDNSGHSDSGHDDDSCIKHKLSKAQDREIIEIEKIVKNRALDTLVVDTDEVTRLVYRNDRGGVVTSSLTFIVIDFNVYDRYLDGMKRLYLPAEVGVAAFSISEGIVDSFSCLIDPGTVQLGSYNTVLNGMRLKGLPRPGFDPNHQNLKEIVTKLENFMRQYPLDENELPPVFYYGTDCDATPGALTWLYRQIGLNSKDYIRLLPLQKLIFHLAALGSDISDISDPVQFMPEPEEMTEIRDSMKNNYGLSRIELAPVVPSSGNFSLFPGSKDGERALLTDSMKFLERRRTFQIEALAGAYLGTSGQNSHNVDLACEFHKKPKNQDPGLAFCAKLVATRLALSSFDALNPLFFSSA